MNPQDLANAQAKFNEAHGSTPLACTGNSQTIQAHQTELEEAIAGQMATITHYDSLVRENTTKRNAAKDRKAVLEMDFERCKRAFWSSRDEEKRSSLPQ